MPTATAAYVIDRALHSIHLLEGLSAALIVLGHPELARIAELVERDAAEARAVLEAQIEHARRNRKGRVLDRLQRMTRMAGPRIAPEAVAVWRAVCRL